VSPEDVVRRIVEALNHVHIPYMLTGSFASSFHGAPRSSNDVDFVIAATADQLRELRNALPESDYYFDLDDALEGLRLKRQFNVIDLREGWKVDLIIRKSRPFSRTEFDRRFQIEAIGIPMFCATAEDVIVSKLEWAKLSGSERQIEDVAGILRVQGEKLDHSYLQHWVHELDVGLEWNRAAESAGFLKNEGPN